MIRAGTEAAGDDGAGCLLGRGMHGEEGVRLVRDWERGACGMYHLHILERQSGPVAV